MDPTAVEADRTFFGLILFKAVYNNDKSYFPNLSNENFAQLHQKTHSLVQNNDDLEFVLYSLACNDLGKTQEFIDHNIRLSGKKAEDHDQLLTQVVMADPNLFPGMQSHLSAEQQRMYVDGLAANLNLGQFAQAENLPYNLIGMQNIPAKSRDLRLLTEIYDFAGVTGHINHNISMVMNDNNFYSYFKCSTELMKEPLDQAYFRYVADRGFKAGIIENDDPRSVMGEENKTNLALSRLVCLSRSFEPSQGNMIKEVWNDLSPNKRAILENELAETGLNGKKGILMYYSPALIANAIIGKDKDFKEGLKCALEHMSNTYKQCRINNRSNSENGFITENVSEAANLAKENKLNTNPVRSL